MATVQKLRIQKHRKQTLQNNSVRSRIIQWVVSTIKALATQNQIPSQHPRNWCFSIQLLTYKTSTLYPLIMHSSHYHPKTLMTKRVWTKILLHPRIPRSKSPQ
uniref:Uncharacterized protein n=1 Tax=Cacopsylla melanoneura TaxID=428564 RepID=A0A8D8W494_9HEMI